MLKWALFSIFFISYFSLPGQSQQKEYKVIEEFYRCLNSLCSDIKTTESLKETRNSFLILFDDSEKNYIDDFFLNHEEFAKTRITDRTASNFTTYILTENGNKFGNYFFKKIYSRIDSTYSNNAEYLIRVVHELDKNNRLADVKHSLEFYISKDSNNITEIKICTKDDKDLDTYLDSLENESCLNYSNFDFGGCPDSDGDKVADPYDYCPEIYGNCNIGCPDQDNDGLVDNISDITKPNYTKLIDKCPEEFGPKSTFGCPDYDNDGVANNDDECIYIPGVPKCNGCQTKKDGSCDLYGIQNIDSILKIPGVIIVESFGDNIFWEILEKYQLINFPDRPFREKNYSMKLIKGGKFQYGCVVDDIGCPTVQIDYPFYIDETEVTNEEYVTFLNHYGEDYVIEGKFKGEKLIAPLTAITDIKKKKDNYYVVSGKENHPMTGVTWYGAYTFAKFYGLDLPLDWEYEYVAKGGSNGESYIYSGGNILDEVAWYRYNSDVFPTTQEVAHPSKNKNSLGLSDLSGNVAEWCLNNFKQSPNLDDDSSTASTRGGAFTSIPQNCEVTSYEKTERKIARKDIGFRCVKRHPNYKNRANAPK